MGYKGVITGHFSGNKMKKEIILSMFDNTGYIANQWDTKLISGENGVNNDDILQLTL